MGALYHALQWVMDFLAEEKAISTIKGELIPLLVSSQGSAYTRALFGCAHTSLCSRKSVAINKHVPVGLASPRCSLMCCAEGRARPAHQGHVARHIAAVCSSSTLNGHMVMLRSFSQTKEVYRCFGLVMPCTDEVFCMRANTLHLYGEINRQVCRTLPPLPSPFSAVPDCQVLAHAAGAS